MTFKSMKRSVVEKKLNDAMRRLRSAESSERSFTIDIDYHDAEASRIRKLRQRVRNQKDRAERTILQMHARLARFE